MKKTLFAALIIACSDIASYAQSIRAIYEIKTYKLKTKAQENTVDAFLKTAYLPALHRLGIKHVGVFKPLETDTTFGKRIVLLIPYPTMDAFASLTEQLGRDKEYLTAGSAYLDAPYNNAPYERLESVVLRAFTGSPQLTLPDLHNSRSERIYELRSYEGPTEKIYQNKVQMFNLGDEVGLFKRLGFNAVFYGEVLSGSRMPNLMYMTTFADQASHDAHWKAFGADAQWKTLVAMPEYQHNVSKSNIYLLRPTDYSDY